MDLQWDLGARATKGYGYKIPKCGSCKALRAIISAGRSGKWGESPTNQPGFCVFEPSKSNTDFMRVSKSPVETQALEFVVLTPTLIWHCSLWLLHIESVFMGCCSGGAGDGKLEEGSAFSGLLDLWSPWIRHNNGNSGPWASVETRLNGCACWNISILWLGTS